MKTKIFFCSGLLLFLFNSVIAQINYESSIGLSLSFNDTWKRVPKELIFLKYHANDFNIYNGTSQPFEVCYQKVGKPDMSYPHVLIKTYFNTSDGESDKDAIIKYFAENIEPNRTMVEINDKSEIKNTATLIQFDKSKNILLIFDKLNNNVSSLFAICFREDRCLSTFFYSSSSDFNFEYSEFIDIIYSINDKGFKDLPEYKEKHDIAIKYYNEAYYNSQAGNKTEAIRLYTKAIENYPIEDVYQKAEAYYNRGLNKRRNNDYEGAISDYTEAINIRFDYCKAYSNRGCVKMLINEFEGAIDDFTQVVKYDNYNSKITTIALGNRGIAKFSINKDGCSDLKKAIDLGSENKNVYEFYNKYCK